MILKLSDLQRSLDQSLATTHGQSRVFVIVARYCAKASTSQAFFPTRDLFLLTFRHKQSGKPTMPTFANRSLPRAFL